MHGEWIGWISSLILLATLGRQVYSQWRAGTTRGVSKWLFVGQLAASTGFSIYSWLLENWVFLVTNIALLLTAVAGEVIFLANRRRRYAPGPSPQPECN
jgi:MtN3 and saliva related transmembrane protein